MAKYTIVGIHDSGLGWISHHIASSADKALQEFDNMDIGCALAVFYGHLKNRVVRNLFPGSPTQLES